MAVFDAPREATDEIDVNAAKPGIVVALIGALVVAAGATTFAQGVQLATLFTLYAWWLKPLPYLLMPLGLLQMALGATASSGRDWAAIAVLALTWMIQLLAIGFTLWTLFAGGLVVMAWVWTALNGLAGLAAPVMVPGTLRASRARRALYR